MSDGYQSRYWKSLEKLAPACALPLPIWRFCRPSGKAPPPPPISEIIACTVCMKNPVSPSSVSLPPLPAHFIPFSPFRCSDYTLVYHANVRPERKSKGDASVTGSVISSVSDEQLPDPELCQRGKTERTPATEC